MSKFSLPMVGSTGYGNVKNTNEKTGDKVNFGFEIHDDYPRYRKWDRDKWAQQLLREEIKSLRSSKWEEQEWLSSMSNAMMSWSRKQTTDEKHRRPRQGQLFVKSRHQRGSV